MQVLTFIALGLVGWFPPTRAYPNANAAICATNRAPVGSTLLLHYSTTNKSATCKVVGVMADSKKYVVSVSEGVRDKLGFKAATDIYVARVVGNLPPCESDPNCRKPTSACTFADSIMICLPSTTNIGGTSVQ